MPKADQTPSRVWQMSMSVLNLNYMTVIQMLLGLCFIIGNVHKCTFEIASLVNIPGEIRYTKVAIRSIFVSREVCT